MKSFDEKCNYTWEQRKVGEVIKSEAFKPYLAEPTADGKYKIIQQGDKPLIGFTNGNPYQNYKNVVLFGDHTLSLHKPKSPFFVATDGVKILSGVAEADGNYLLYLLEKYRPQSEGYKRYYSILKNCICYTTLSRHEQKHLGDIFNTLDHLITLHQRKPFCNKRR